MPKKEDRFFPARLLSRRRRYTIQEKESVLKTLLDQVEREEQRTFKARLRSPVGVLVASVCALLIAVPVAHLLFERGEVFTPKGDNEAFPLFGIRCIADEVPAPCERGNEIAFRVDPPEGMRYFSAFAKHRSSGVVIWYFPNDENEPSLEIRRYLKQGALIEGIRIGAKHAPGIYDVYGVYSRNAMRRSEIRALIEEAGTDRKTDDIALISKRILKIEQSR